MKKTIVIASLLSVAGSALADPPRYRVQLIEPVGNDNSSIAVGINNLGQVVGGSCSSYSPNLGSGRAFVWSAGTTTLIGGGMKTTEGFDINDSGVAVFEGAPNQTAAYRYDSNTGTVSQLSGAGIPRGISASGMVVGTVGGDDHRLPAYWAPGSSSPTAIFTESGNPQGIIQGVNASGAVLGRDDYTQNPGNAFSFTRDSWVWKNGTFLDLARPEGDNSSAYAINDLGRAAGVVNFADGSRRTGVWDYSSGTPVFKYITGTSSAFTPTAINASGDIIGMQYGERWALDGSGSYLYTGGHQYDFNSLLDLTDPTTARFFNEGGGVQTVFDMNDKGQVVGFGYDPDTFNVVGFIATPQPVPEPAAIVTLALGALVTLRRRAKK